MATQAQIDSLRLRRPNLPASLEDENLSLYLDDAAVEFDRFGIIESDPIYDKCLSLYALHLLTIAGLINDVSSESVKDVSASYALPPLANGDTRYYQEFKKTLRRNKPPGFILVST
jgi:hypothetical protein